MWDDRARRAAITVALVGVSAGAGCRHVDPDWAPGISEPRIDPDRRSPSPNASARSRWSRFAEIERCRPIGDRFVSWGHFDGRWDAETLANEIAATLYEGGGRSSVLPPGSLVAERLWDRSSHTAGPIFVMTKSPDRGDAAATAWEFLAVDRDGVPNAEVDVTLCARCHAEGGADSLFGPMPRRLSPDAGELGATRPLGRDAGRPQ